MEIKHENRRKRGGSSFTCLKMDSPELAELAGDANQSPELLRSVLSSLKLATLALTKLIGDLIRSRQLPAVREVKNEKRMERNGVEPVKDVVAGRLLRRPHTHMSPELLPARVSSELGCYQVRKMENGEWRWWKVKTGGSRGCGGFLPIFRRCFPLGNQGGGARMGSEP